MPRTSAIAMIAATLVLAACGDQQATTAPSSSQPTNHPPPAANHTPTPSTSNDNTAMPAVSDAEMARKAPPPSEAQLADVEPDTSAMPVKPDVAGKSSKSSSGKPATSTTASSRSTATAPAKSETAALLTRDQALALAAKGNCLACHKIESKLVGPAWQWVGDKYKDDPNGSVTIASHIKSGGSFGWKFGVMPPRGGSKLPDADVEALAGYIATLRK